MKSNLTRRQMMAITSKAVLAGSLFPTISPARDGVFSNQIGAVVGEPVAAKVGEQFLADGANAIDAAVATALAATITSPGKCGVGGYGGHAIIGLANGKVTAIDFNSTAPAAAHEDMFPLDANGNVKGKINVFGWLAAAVPGTLAGLELALNRYGTRSFREVVGPAIQLCEEGVHIRKESVQQAALDASKNNAAPKSPQTTTDPKQQNLPLAKLLRTLAERNSTDSFYRGDIARKIAQAFQKNGGLVTFDDLAAYRAIEIKPLSLKWDGMTIYTPPLTAAGVIFLEAIAILKELNWRKLSSQEQLHSKLEALRIAWADRNQFFGDPEHVKVPLAHLFSRAQISRRAKEIKAALNKEKPVSLEIAETDDKGTINISAVDRSGNMIALTLTHGSGYGARVSVEEFGMVLGHGMWRFEPRPGHPNSPGPRKKAVNNMCPAVVIRGGKPVMAVGAAGGTRIPCGVYEVLLNYVGLGASLEAAINAPRLHTTGTLKVETEKIQSSSETAFLKKLGYKVSSATSAYVSGISFDSKTKQSSGIMRGGSY